MKERAEKMTSWISPLSRGTSGKVSSTRKDENLNDRVNRFENPQNSKQMKGIDSPSRHHWRNDMKSSKSKMFTSRMKTKSSKSKMFTSKLKRFQVMADPKKAAKFLRSLWGGGKFRTVMPVICICSAMKKRVWSRRSTIPLCSLKNPRRCSRKWGMLVWRVLLCPIRCLLYGLINCAWTCGCNRCEARVPVRREA